MMINGEDVSNLKAVGQDCEDRPLLLAIYETLWRAMERENNLINQRMMWPITLSSAFIIAESFLVKPIFDQVASNKVNISSLALCSLNIFISLLGIQFSWRAKNSVDAAIMQLRKLRTFYERCTIDGKPLFETVLFLPQPHGNDILHEAGTSAATAFPSALLWTWVIFVLGHSVTFITLLIIILQKGNSSSDFSLLLRF